MAASASSQFGLVLLFSVGTLLLLTMAPQFGTGKTLHPHGIINLIFINSNSTALECYKVGNLPPLKLDKMMNSTTTKHLLGMPTPNGDEPTEQCGAYTNWCITFYCERSKVLHKMP
jgi:hypothetical protein